MTARRDLALATQGAEMALDETFARMAPALRASVLRHVTGSTIDDAAHRAILADLDILLGTAYGRRHGERSPVWLAITRWANAAALAPVDRAVADIERRLSDEPVLLERMRAG